MNFTNAQGFKARALDASSSKPVLVDFYAEYVHR